ncbi:MAG: zinc-binding alcohol dehydrogenase family protein [Proteobacteria bacterium]|nr:zinc-binding alcohol dehydrogenase family protein [Pseudomonadota bacterium]
MKAVGYRASLPISDVCSLMDIETSEPQPGPRDLLVKVKAISVNPIDTKMRMRQSADAPDWRILGWDAAGEVVAKGNDCQKFKVGDHVYYAGSLTRSGTNAEFHCVDERIVGRKPARLSHAEAAAIPLTALTAWETLFDRLDVNKSVPGAKKSILIIGGAGGVGSLAIQFAKQIAHLKVAATASREETKQWCLDLGADIVFDHHQNLNEQFVQHDWNDFSFAFSTNQSHKYAQSIADGLAPQGRFALIDDPDLFDVKMFKRKSISIHWELMFTRALFATSDQDHQGFILDQVANYIDQNIIRTTVGGHYGAINATNLRKAHADIESGTVKGKIVLEGF